VVGLATENRDLHGDRNYTHSHPSPQISFPSPSRFTSIPAHPRRILILSPPVPAKLSFHLHLCPYKFVFIYIPFRYVQQLIKLTDIS